MKGQSHFPWQRPMPFSHVTSDCLWWGFSSAQLSLARENQATKSERKDEEISICIIIYLAFEQWTKQSPLPARSFFYAIQLSHTFLARPCIWRSLVVCLARWFLSSEKQVCTSKLKNQKCLWCNSRLCSAHHFFLRLKADFFFWSYVIT